MATIGQPLTSPEIGWRRFEENDSNINYFGSWLTTHDVKVGASGGYWAVSKYNFSGQVIKFNFTGDKFRIIGYNGSAGSSDITVKVDNIPHTISEHSSDLSDPANILVFEKLNLENKEHYVEIINNTTYYLVLDAIDIDSNGGLKPYNVPKKKYLIQSKTDNSIYIIKSTELTNIGVATVTEGLFTDVTNNATLDTLKQLTFSYDKTMTDSGVLGNGKIFTLDINNTSWIKDLTITQK